MIERYNRIGKAGGGGHDTSEEGRTGRELPKPSYHCNYYYYYYYWLK